MSDIEDLPVETVAGERPPSAVADRLLIGLALLALLGGMAIAVANLFGGLVPEAAETRTPSPRPEVTPPLATPRAGRTPDPLREVSVVPGEPPEPADMQGSEAYWLEALRPLILRSAASEGAPELGRLEPGTVAIAERQTGTMDGWLYVYEPQPGGYVRVVGLDGRDRARLTSVGTPSFEGSVSALAAGPGGFVARGMPAWSGWAPTEIATLFSADGEHWQASPMREVGGWGSWDFAWGPSGWLGIGRVDDPVSGIGSLWVWESADGRDWEPVGSLPLPGDAFVARVVASEAGYLLVLNSPTGEAQLWYSPDGILWQEAVHPFEGMSGRPSYEFGMNLRISATAHGFMAWRVTEGLSTTIPAAFSADGRAWRVVNMEDGSGSWLHLAVVGDTLLGLGRDPSGVVRAYRADLAVDPINLSRVPHQDLAFDGVVLWNLISDGTTAFAFGYERATLAPVAWRSSSGGSWTRIDVPDAGFGGPVQLAVAGPAGVVVAGIEHHGLAADPVFWHMRPDGTWVREPSPVIQPMPRPGPADCGAPPDSALEFMGLDPRLAVPCFGDSPMTFTAWSARCQGCGGAGEPGNGEPAWLLQPENQLYLLPAEMRMDGGWSKEAILHGDLAWRPEWTNTWLRVTGHFDDPAAQSCRWHPRPDEEPYYWGPEADISRCRAKFVITELDVVSGPEPAGEAAP